MDPEAMETKILGYLNRDRGTYGRRATRKEICRHLGDPPASKKDVKRALRRLVKRGRVTKEGKTYACDGGGDGNDAGAGAGTGAGAGGETRRRTHCGDGGDASEGVTSERDEDDADDASPVLPIARRLRQKTDQESTNNDRFGTPRKIDLDEEIARLEAELAADDSESASESDGEGSGSDDKTEQRPSEDIKKAISFGTNSFHEYVGTRGSRSQQDGNEDRSSAPGIISLSKSANDRIKPLPQSSLPQNKRRTLKIDREDGQAQSDVKRTKRKRPSSTPELDQCHTVSAGLKSAVAELLQNYVPSSQLALPFYCRVCQHQSSTQEEFDAHRASDFHRGAAREERKRTYCKLCRKQLTSVVQMEEHLRSRPHRERMDFVKGKQRGGGGGVRSGGGGGRGGGAGGRGHHQNRQRGARGRQSTLPRGRQWC